MVPRCIRLQAALLLLHVAALQASSPSAALNKPEQGFQLPNAVRHTLASVSAGACGVTLSAPIEVVRLNMMNKGLTVRAAAATLRKGIFRGNTADVIQSASRTGIVLPAFAAYKGLARKLVMRMDPTFAEDAPLPKWAIFGAGACAGATATIILFPLEVARTRMATECVIGQSTIGCLQTVFNAEGLRAVYRGLTASMVGVMPFNAIKLTSYDTIRGIAIQAQQRSLSLDDSLSDGRSIPVGLSPPVTAVIGAVSGVTAATACFPIEVIRRRKMMGELVGLGVPQAIATLARKEGVIALYRGVFVNAGKVTVGTGTTFCLYELMKDCLRVDGRVPPWERH